MQRVPIQPTINLIRAHCENNHEIVLNKIKEKLKNMNEDEQVCVYILFLLYAFEKVNEIKIDIYLFEYCCLFPV